MPSNRALKGFAVAVTVALVLAPMPFLLPSLNERAILSWHVLNYTDGLAASSSVVAILLLGGYFGLLVIRYVAFLVGSTLDATLFQASGARFVPGKTDASRPWPMVSIVVPAFNEGPVIRQSIQSLLQLDYPYYEILVIDDGSTDDTYARAREAAQGCSRVRVIRKPNGGKASALNAGMANARGTLILNMDADSKLSGNALRACVRHFFDPAVGAVAGNIKVANRENVVTRLQSIEYIQGLALERRAQSVIKAVSVIGGPLGMFRKVALQQVGGYDSDTFAEDRDLTLKLLAHGWTVTYEPRARAWAESPSRWLDLLSQRYRWTRGTVQAIIKHRWALLNVRGNPVMSFSLWYMAADSLFVPLVNLCLLLFFGFLALAYEANEYLLLWWTQIALFDVAVTCYCVVLDREDTAHIPYALLLRFYAIFTDVAKLLATIEELMRVDMTWGKLKREGKI